MTKVIDAVPENITHEDYVALIKSLGFNPNDLTELIFSLDGIYATVHSKDEQGRPQIDHARNEIARHIVHIPIVDIPTSDEARRRYQT
jgi:hypothetical protein